ncbi:MAG: N-acetylmuramoyl-L-alanine amidase [Candidatus Roizmanbacteria bacterium]|nr:N-acetylmuramoyl-L-alanine amidase [Candidatus Roizmanbacteria bacterium]
MTITWKGAKAFTKGREGHKVKNIVVHWVGEGNLETAHTWFNRITAKTSAHYGVENTKVYQWVKDEDTAWAVGDWVGNLESISIEHSATPTRPATEQTYLTSAELIRTLCRDFGLPIDKETIRPHKFYKATACPGTIDIDKLISLAKEEPMSANLFDPEKDLPTWLEDSYDLKDKPWYDKRGDFGDLVTVTDQLYQSEQILTRQIETLNETLRISDLRRAELASTVSERDKMITTLTNEINGLKNDVEGFKVDISHIEDDLTGAMAKNIKLLQTIDKLNAKLDNDYSLISWIKTWLKRLTSLFQK